jgi:flagellar hook-associated protein 2
MVSAIGSSTSIKLESDSSLTGLGSYFQSLVKATMTAQKTLRMDGLTAKKDSLATRKSMFNDLKSTIADLQTQFKTLVSTEATYALTTSSRKASITGVASGSSVLSATVDSTTTTATYEISDIELSTTHRVMSDRQSSSTTALSYGGTMVINGTSIDVGNEDTLMGIASKINSATYDEGKGVSATVVDNRLVLQAKTSGDDGTLTLSGAPLRKLNLIDSGDAIIIQNQLSAGANGSITVNGIPVDITKNTGLTDIINGVTINLAADAEGKTVSLTVETDVDSLKKNFSTLSTKFNALVDYLDAKTSSKKVDEKTYTRGALADDFTFRNMTKEMTSRIQTSLSTGTYKSLSEIGLTVDSKMHLTVSDSTQLGAALEDNFAAVQTLLDTKMTAMSDYLAQYVDSDTGIMTYTLSSIDDQSKMLDSSITRETSRLNSQQLMLIQQYTDMQNTLTALQNTQTTWSSIYSAIYSTSGSSSSSTNLYG